MTSSAKTVDRFWNNLVPLILRWATQGHHGPLVHRNIYRQCSDYTYMKFFMKIKWQLWLPWQLFMKNFKWHFLWKYWANLNEISYLAFMWCIYNIKIKWVMIWNSRWRPCPYMVKTIYMPSYPEPPSRLGWYFTGSIWGTSLYKVAKIVSVGS